MTSRKGSALVFFVAILALAVAAIAVYTFRDKIVDSLRSVDCEGEQTPKVIAEAEQREKLRNDTSWTETNIRARPDLYLADSRNVLTKALGQCEDSIFELQTKLNLNESEAKRSESETKPMLDFLRAARDTLKDAAAKYPAKVGVYYYDSAAELEKAFWATDAKIRSLKAVALKKLQDVDGIKSAIEKLKSERDDIRKTLEAIPEMVAQLKNNAFSGDITKVATELDEIKARMKTLGSTMLPSGKDIGRVEPEPPKKTIDEVCSEWGL